MPTFYKGDQQVVTYDRAEIEALLADGWQAPASVEGGLPVQASGGATTDVRPDLLRFNLDQGAQVLPGADVAQRGLDAQREANYDNDLGAGLSGAGSVLSFGASDVALDALGVPIKEIAGHNPISRGVGEGIAIAGTILSPLGKGTLASKLPTVALSEWAAAGTTGLARVARTAGEGAAWGLGQEVSKIALSDPGFAGEGVLADMAMGSFLGAAFGVVGGVAVEGVGKLAASRAARPVAGVDFTTGPGKAVIGAQANAHKTIEEMVAYTVKTDADDLAMQVAAHRKAGALARSGDVSIAETAARQASKVDDAVVGPLVDSIRDVRRAVDDPTMFHPDDVNMLWLNHNTAAKALGGARLSRAELKGVVRAAEAGDMGPLGNLLAQAEGAVKNAALHDGTAERLLAKYAKTQSEDDALKYLKHLHNAGTEHGATTVVEAVEASLKRGTEHGTKAAELAGTKSAAAAVNAAEARLALAHVAKNAPGPDAFLRMTRMEPEAAVDAAAKIGKYWETAIEATKHNPVANARIKDALGMLGESMGLIVTKESKALLTPDVLAASLGVAVSQLPIIPDAPGPIDDILMILAVHKLTKGTIATKGPARGMANRMLRSMAGRFGATAGANATRSIPGVGALPGVVQAGIAGGGWTGGRQVADMAMAAMPGGSGLKSVVNTQAVATARIKDAAGRLSTGKPAKRRVMPALDAIFNKLLPDEEHKNKKPAQKFKVVQDRLAQYTTSPQSFSAKFYEMLKPAQQVSEQLADVMETTLGMHLQYAADTMPKDPGTMMMMGKSMWVPTDRQLYEWGLRLMGTMYPLDTVDMVADGLVPPQAVEALRDTNPGTFAKFQEQVIENIDAIRENSTYDQRISLGLAFSLPLDPTTDPRYVAFMQSMHAQKSMEQAAGNAAETKTPEEGYSDAQKLLA